MKQTVCRPRLRIHSTDVFLPPVRVDRAHGSAVTECAGTAGSGKALRAGGSFRSVISYILLIVSVAAAGCASGEPSLPGLTEEEIRDGWELIFDGQSLQGWRGLNMDGIPEDHWIVEDGLLKKVDRNDVPRGPDGERQPVIDLVYDRPLNNFELYFEWKVTPVANSGIKYNVSETLSSAHGNRHSALGFEYQIIDDPEYPHISENPSWATAGLYELVDPSPGIRLYPVGEWNSGRIVFDGTRGEHWLNGRLALSYDMSSPEMKEALAASKWSEIGDFGRRHENGYIILQDHSDTVWYRNIRLRELP